MSEPYEAQGQQVTVQVHVYLRGTCSSVRVETTLPLSEYAVKRDAKQIFMTQNGLRSSAGVISAQIPEDERKRLQALYEGSLAVA